MEVVSTLLTMLEENILNDSILYDLAMVKDFDDTS